MASGCSHGPCTFARNTSGAPVTQKRAWMQRLVSNNRSSLAPGAVSTPLAIVDGAARAPAPDDDEPDGAVAYAAPEGRGADALAGAAKSNPRAARFDNLA